MSNDNVTIAEAYYKAMEQKDFSTLEKYLHPDVQLIGPMAHLHSKEVVLDSIKKFAMVFTKITIRERFSTGDKVLLVYDLECPAPIGTIRACALFTIKNKLIECNEIFYDAMPFFQKKEEIFTNS